MSSSVPNLSSTYYEMLDLTVYFDRERLDVQKVFDQRGVADLDFELARDGEVHRVGLDISRDNDGDVRISVAVVYAKIFNRDDLNPVYGSEGALWHALEPYFRFQAGILVAGTFELDADSVPREGLVASIADVATKLGDMELSITGVELSVKGSPVHRLHWAKRQDKLRGQVFAILETPLSKSVMSDGLAVLLQYGDTLLLGKGE